MDSKAFYKMTFRTVLPLMIQSLLLASVNFIGQAMVSRLGVTEVAAVGVANKIYSIYFLVLYGTSCACVMFVSQFKGKNDIDGLRRTMGMTLSITVALGVIVTLATWLFPRQCLSLFSDDQKVIENGVAYLKTVSLSYLLLSFIYPINYMLRGITKVQIVMITSVLSVIVTTVISYIFIFGHLSMPALGVTGAALATVLTRAAELMVLLIYLKASRNPIMEKLPTMFKYTKLDFKKFLYKAVPLAGNEMFWGIGTTLYFVIYGRMGTAQLAAMSIMNTIQTLEQTFALSLSGAGAVILGNEIGKGNKDELALLAGRFHKLALMVGGVVSIVLFFLRGSILELYQLKGTLTGEYLSQCLLAMSCFVIIHCFNSMNVEGLLRSGGDVKFVLLMDVGGIWLIGLPLTFIFGEVLHLPLIVVYLVFVIVELYKLPLGIYRSRTMKWAQQL
ncbi:MATE family efflux transporter [Spirochaeta cellobiosiphila]|uniref:MATE family efflux transporter n=1 Tax=Spirochaeta cellobiosiphila TaxID=504483 RepID=UPI000416013A|nr:MATE family efflux transporter [Spirochaeta cellobiosiphila]